MSNPEVSNAKEIHPLANAVAQEDYPMAENLLRQGDDVNKRVSADAAVYAGFTPLMIAAGLGNEAMVKLLLAHGADVFIMDSYMGTTALHKAAQNGNVEVAKLLVEKEAFIDAQAPTLGNTPLLDAVWHQHPKMVKYLLDKGARTELTTRSGTKAITISETDTNQEIIGLLKKHEASRANEIAHQELMTAAEANDVGTVIKLLAKDVDVNAKAPLVGDRFDGYTPLLAAAFLGHDEVVKVLLADKRIKPREVDDMIKATTYHKAGYHGNKKAAQALVDDGRRRSNRPNLDERGPNLDEQGPYNGYTALHDAIWHHHKETVQVFLDADANLDLKTHTGRTPLELAKELEQERSSHPEIAKAYREIAMIIEEKIKKKMKQA